MRRMVWNHGWLALAVLAAAVVVVAVAAPTRSDPAAKLASEAEVDWRPAFRGIDYAAWQAEKPRPLSWHAVRIDVSEPGVRFLVTPSNGERPLDADSLRTSSFLDRYDCQVAINGSAFAPLRADEGRPQDVRGVSVSNSQAYSSADNNYGALLIDRQKLARIVRGPVSREKLVAAEQALAGFYPLLLEERIVVDEKTIPGKRHPRTAVGVSKDRQTLYLLVVDGRQKDFSEGVTLIELAEQMRTLGAYDALNLDGGGSTTLVFEDQQGLARVMNRPIHRGQPGAERAVANHLGVYAERLEAK